jgi:uncharacterized membrane protein YfcA
MGLPPATVSATVHAAECFSTGASAVAHKYFGNIDKVLFRKLVIPGVIGAVAGAYILASLPGESIKPFVSAYLALMGLFIIFKSMKAIEARLVRTGVVPLGLAGSFIDAIGGGGWGPIVATTLIARGNDIRKTIGTVNAAEFFVTMAASVTFFLTIGFSHWQAIAGMAAGAIVAAPLGAWLCKKIPARPFMVAVGLLVFGLGVFNIISSLT